MNAQWIGIALSALIGVTGLVYAFTRNRRTDDTALRETLEQLAARVVRVETKIEVFWKGVSYSAAEALHSPTDHLGIDSLIDKFRRGQLRDEDEIATFKTAMQEIVASDPDPFRRKAAREVLLGIRLQFEITPGAVFTEASG
jgi:hypothetical protein